MTVLAKVALIGIVIFSADLFALTPTDSSLIEMYKAQEAYLKNDRTKMMEHLFAALRAKPEDNVLSAQAARFAKKYYIEDQPRFSLPQAAKLTLAIKRKKRNKKPHVVEFYFASWLSHAEVIRQLTVTSPEGQVIPLIGADLKREVYPAKDPRFTVVWGHSKDLPTPLLTGIYVLRIEWKDRSVTEVPLILAPDNREETFLQARFLPKNSVLNWKAPVTSATSPRALRTAYFQLYKEGFDRPIWDKIVELKSPGRESGQIAVSISERQNLSFKSTYWESAMPPEQKVNGPGHLSLLYEHEWVFSDFMGSF